MSNIRRFRSFDGICQCGRFCHTDNFSTVWQVVTNIFK